MPDKTIKANHPYSKSDSRSADVGVTAGGDYVYLGVHEERGNADSECYAVAHFTPKRARKLARAIVRAADRADDQ